MKRKSPSFCLLLGLILNIESKSTPIVQTTKGPVQGEVLKTAINSIDYSSFKGIPYAEPPIGYLRFKPPVEKKPWTSVIQTTIEGANCVQRDFVYLYKYTGSEDCLYLNVYTPKLQFENSESELLPVMVYIYGGSFKSGYGNSSLYGPDYIIEEDVILVTFNYRVGPIGFLNLNHENATGNAGLKDQNLVLRWVKENINKFGGNPNNVTIFGQSAGGASVDYQGLSELSRGLFHRSITMSASSLCPWTFEIPEAAVKQAFVLGEMLGKSTSSIEDLLKFLYEASAVEMMKKTEEMALIEPPFKPSIENANLAKHEAKFLTECSYWKYVSGNFNKVPHMTGFTADEMLLFAGLGAEFVSDMAHYATKIEKSYPNSSSVPLPATKNVFPKTIDEVKDLPNDILMELIQETSAVIFVAGIDFKRKLIHSRSGYPVYYYRFSFESDDSLHEQFYGIHMNGTAHGDDFAYLFHMTVAKQSLDPHNPSFITRKRMVRLWTNFAKYSDPTPHGEMDTLLQGITWPDTGKSDRYLEFGKDLSIRENPVDATVSSIGKIYPAVLPIQTGCVGNLLEDVSNLDPFSSGEATSI